ncbi:MAG: hypothetical protein ACI8Y4_001074 [Candidatus Poriferisodalaceae bacterium]|jgi:hypothetical protein
MTEAASEATDLPGQALMTLSWSAVAVLAVALGLGVAFVSPLAPLAATVSLILFAGGLAAYIAAYAVGVRRSRDEEISVAGMFVLQGTAPLAVRRSFLWSITAQILVSVVAASIRPFTTVAFGILAPTFGLGLMALWGARHGTFGPRSRR